jgi:hypothetical protein
MQKLLHAVDILCINYYEAFQRKKRANSWSDCHSRIECLDSKSVIKNLLGFRACNFQHVSLASGRAVFSAPAAQIPAKQKSGCPRLVGQGGGGGKGKGIVSSPLPLPLPRGLMPMPMPPPFPGAPTAGALGCRSQTQAKPLHAVPSSPLQRSALGFRAWCESPCCYTHASCFYPLSTIRYLEAYSLPQLMRVPLSIRS